jgi:hypothetical protein
MLCCAVIHCTRCSRVVENTLPYYTTLYCTILDQTLLIARNMSASMYRSRRISDHVWVFRLARCRIPCLSCYVIGIFSCSFLRCRKLRSTHTAHGSGAAVSVAAPRCSAQLRQRLSRTQDRSHGQAWQAFGEDLGTYGASGSSRPRASTKGSIPRSSLVIKMVDVQ